MKHIIPSYKLQLIRESSNRYEVENTITKPIHIKEIAEKVLELNKNAEMVLCILALNNKNKVIGTFEVSRGTINQSLVSQREIFKRLILLNSARFIALHNHPSGNENPSCSDIQVAEKLQDAGMVLDIPLIDFCILGERELYSFAENGVLD